MSRAKSKSKSNLSFGNDFEDEEKGSSFSMMRQEIGRHDTADRKHGASNSNHDEDDGPLLSAPLKKPILLDFATTNTNRPKYGSHDLEDLKKETPQHHKILAGDELDEMLKDAEKEEEEEEEGEEVIPTVEQIRVAKERRERMRKQGGDLNIESEDFMPLKDGDNDMEDNNEGSRLVRDKDDDSDEPFEEHRGPTIKFGKPEDAEKSRFQAMKSESLENGWNEWELEQIRKGAYDRASELKERADEELSDKKKKKKRKSHAPRSAIPFSVIQNGVKKRYAEESERARVLRQQMSSAMMMKDEGVSDLPSAMQELKLASSKYDFLQKTRNYILNLISCIEGTAENIVALEKKLIQKCRLRFDESIRQNFNGGGNEGHFVDLDTTEISKESADIFEDVIDDYCNLRNILANFEAFRKSYPELFFGAMIDECLVDIIVHFVKWNLLSWNPILDPLADRIADVGCFQLLAHFGDHSKPSTELNFMKILKATFLKKLVLLVTEGFDPTAKAESERAKEVFLEFVVFFPDINEILPLLDAIVQKVRTCLVDVKWAPMMNSEDGYVVVLRRLESAALWSSCLPQAQWSEIQSAIIEFGDAHLAPKLALEMRESFVRRIVTRLSDSQGLSSIDLRECQLGKVVRMMIHKFNLQNIKLLV